MNRRDRIPHQKSCVISSEAVLTPNRDRPSGQCHSLHGDSGFRDASGIQTHSQGVAVTIRVGIQRLAGTRDSEIAIPLQPHRMIHPSSNTKIPLNDMRQLPTTIVIARNLLLG